MVEKIRSLPTFYALPKKQQKAVMMLFSHKYTQVEIAADIHVSPQTVSAWKQHQQFRQAQDEYNQFMLHDLTSEAVMTMRSLLHAKSEMVRYNAAAYVIEKATPEVHVEDDLQAEWTEMVRQAELEVGANHGG